MANPPENQRFDWFDIKPILKTYSRSGPNRLQHYVNNNSTVISNWEMSKNHMPASWQPKVLESGYTWGYTQVHKSVWVTTSPQKNRKTVKPDGGIFS